jgi:hypothetical protein
MRNTRRSLERLDCHSNQFFTTNQIGEQKHQHQLSSTTLTHSHHQKVRECKRERGRLPDKLPSHKKPERAFYTIKSCNENDGNDCSTKRSAFTVGLATFCDYGESSDTASWEFNYNTNRRSILSSSRPTITKCYAHGQQQTTKAPSSTVTVTVTAKVKL